MTKLVHTSLARSNKTFVRHASATLAVGVLHRGATPPAGVQLGIDETQRAAKLTQREVTFVTEQISTDEQTANGIAAAATRLTKRGPVHALLGGESDEESAMVSELALRNDVLYFNTASRSDALRGGGCNRNVFHVMASQRMLDDVIKLSQSVGTPSVWSSALNKYGADTLNTRFRSRFGTPMTDRAWADWFAIKVLWETFLRVRETAPAALIEALEREGTRFDGHKGRPLSFRSWDHQLRQPLYVVPPGSGANVIEVPGTSNADESAQHALDQLGATAEESACHFHS